MLGRKAHHNEREAVADLKNSGHDLACRHLIGLPIRVGT
jgi:hypothetical protein